MLRTLKLWARPRRVRMPVGGTSELRMRVWPQEIDLNLHMNNGRYFSVADLGRLDWWLETGVWWPAIRRGWRPVAGGADGRFLKSLQPFQAYRLQTRMLGWNDKWFFAEHRFVCKGQVWAVINVRYLFVAKGPRPAPAEVLALVGHTEPSPPLPDWIQLWDDAQTRLTRSIRSR